MQKVILLTILSIFALSACSPINVPTPTTTPTELLSTATATDLPIATETPTPLPTETVTPMVEPTLSECEILQSQPWVLGLDQMEVFFLAESCEVEWPISDLSNLGPKYTFSNGFGVEPVINENGQASVETRPYKDFTIVENNFTIKQININYYNNILTFSYLDEVIEFESWNGKFLIFSMPTRYVEAFQIQ